MLGTVNIDNQGIAGIEKYIDGAFLNDLQMAGFDTGGALEPVRLSIDLRVQHVVRDELVRSMELYQAIAAIGIVLDVNTGEVIAMSSLPDYDPNNRDEALDPDRMNRATVGVYEMGSTFKGFTTAMALDSGRVNINSSFDARGGLRVGRHTINDFHGKHRVLTVPEIFIYSSNIGTARMALAAGTPEQEDFLQKVGLLDPMRTELPEVGAPLVAEAAVVDDLLGHHLVRTRHLGLADADRGGRRGADQRRLPDPADLPAAHAGAGGAARAAGHAAGDQPAHAPSLPPERAEGLRAAGRRRRLQRRRQDRHGGEGGERPLFRRQAAQRLPRRVSRWTRRAIWCWWCSTSRSRRSRASAQPPG